MVLAGEAEPDQAPAEARLGEEVEVIRALATGKLSTDPQQRTSRNGKPFAFARLSVANGEEGHVSCSVITFQDEAVARLMQLRAGASVAAAGTLTVKIFTRNDGSVIPSLDMVADEIASTTPRPRKPRGRQEHSGGDEPFSDLPGADNLDDWGARHD
jgi:single-stranded DNA-binding protein